MILTDSHCHLEADTPERVAGVLADARTAGVGTIVSMGMDLETSRETVGIAATHKDVYVGVGIHPWHAVDPTADVRNSLSNLAGEPRVAFLGEMGLDYSRTPETRETQLRLLRYQLALARETGLPVSLHCRGEAHEDMMALVSRGACSGLRGVIHGFAGTRSQLQDWLDLGFYVGVGARWFIYRIMPEVVEIVPAIPLEHLLIETDSSARARNAGESAGPVDVRRVAEKVAALHGTALEEIAQVSTDNLRCLLGGR